MTPERKKAIGAGLFLGGIASMFILPRITGEIPVSGLNAHDFIFGHRPLADTLLTGGMITSSIGLNIALDERTGLDKGLEWGGYVAAGGLLFLSAVAAPNNPTFANLADNAAPFTLMATNGARAVDLVKSTVGI